MSQPVAQSASQDRVPHPPASSSPAKAPGRSPSGSKGSSSSQLGKGLPGTVSLHLIQGTRAKSIVAETCAKLCDYLIPAGQSPHDSATASSENKFSVSEENTETVQFDLDTAKTTVSGGSSCETPRKAQPPRYEVLGLLGSGAYGHALLAKDRTTDQYCAIKVLVTESEPASSSAHRRAERLVSEIDCHAASKFFSVVEFLTSFSAETPANWSPPPEMMTSPRPLDEDGFTSPPGRHAATLSEPSSMSRPHSRGLSVASSADRMVDLTGPTLTEGDVTSPEPSSLDAMVVKMNRTTAIVMEFADCGDLRQEVKYRAKTKDNFSEQEARLLFVQLIMALHRIHSKGIAHRDVKTSNIFMTAAGVIKLGDFGFARELQKEEKESTFLGTPYYLAPEVWKKESCTEKVDIFAAGVVLYELLAFTRPFEGTDMSKVCRAIQEQNMRPLPTTMSSDVRKLLLRMLDRDPAKRPSAAEILTTEPFLAVRKQFSQAINKSYVNTELKKKILDDCRAMDDELKPLLPQETIIRTDSSQSGVSSSGNGSTAADGTLSVTSGSQSNGASNSMGSHGSGAAPENGVYASYVKKRSHIGSGESWKTRYLRLQRNFAGSLEIVLGVTENDIGVSRRSIATPLDDFSSVRYETIPMGNGEYTTYSFALESHRWKCLEFSVESKEELGRWEVAFTSVNLRRRD